MKTELGKIEKVEFGHFDGRFGFTYTLYAGGWNVLDFKGFWSMVPTENYKWTVDDQDKAFAAAWRHAMELMNDAKVQDLQKLVGKPIEVTTERMMLKSWRILTEVI
jgi:hypothetical protein